MGNSITASPDEISAEITAVTSYSDANDFAEQHGIKLDGQKSFAALNSTFRAAFTYAAEIDPEDPSKINIDWDVYHADKSSAYTVTETIKINPDGSVTTSMKDMEGHFMRGDYERGMVENLRNRFNENSMTVPEHEGTPIGLYAQEHSLPIGSFVEGTGEYSVAYPEPDNDRLAETSSCTPMNATTLLCITNIHDEGAGTGLKDSSYSMKYEIFRANSDGLTAVESAEEADRDLRVEDGLDLRVSEIKEYHPTPGTFTFSP